MIHPDLFVSLAGSKGRGVYTSKDVPAGTVVEISPVIVMSGTDRLLLDQTLLHDYIFEWGQKKSACCLGLGYISLYNHSYQANCVYEMDYVQATIGIRAVRTIKASEELLINYNGDWDDAKPVWFDDNK